AFVSVLIAVCHDQNASDIDVLRREPLPIGDQGVTQEIVSAGLCIPADQDGRFNQHELSSSAPLKRLYRRRNRCYVRVTLTSLTAGLREFSEFRLSISLGDIARRRALKCQRQLRAGRYPAASAARALRNSTRLRGETWP